eukprot:1188093-Amphidinium_carterae.1
MALNAVGVSHHESTFSIRSAPDAAALMTCYSINNTDCSNQDVFRQDSFWNVKGLQSCPLLCMYGFCFNGTPTRSNCPNKIDSKKET